MRTTLPLFFLLVILLPLLSALLGDQEQGGDGQGAEAGRGLVGRQRRGARGEARRVRKKTERQRKMKRLTKRRLQVKKGKNQRRRKSSKSGQEGDSQKHKGYKRRKQTGKSRRRQRQRGGRKLSASARQVSGDASSCALKALQYARVYEGKASVIIVQVFPNFCLTEILFCKKTLRV